jgi:hypothetical protein
MNKPLFRWVLLFCFILLSTQTIVAEQFTESFYHQYVPDGWVLEWWDSSSLDPTFGQPSIILGMYNVASHHPGEEYNHLNQIYLLHFTPQGYQVVWKSEQFSGVIKERNYEDTNNNGSKNLNLVYITQENGQKKLNLLVYDWSPQYFQKIYPVNDVPQIQAELEYIFLDYGEDGAVEVITKKLLTKEPYDQFQWDIYHLENSQMILQTTLCTDPPQKSSYDTVALVAEQNSTAPIEDIVGLLEDSIYLVLFSVKEGEQTESRYMIIDFDGDTAKVRYKLDPKLNHLSFLMYNDDDYNMDGYKEIILTEKLDYGIDLYYFFTVKPEKVQLITPINDEGQSLVWQYESIDPIITMDRDRDGVYELYSDIENDGEVDTLIWRWNADLQQYVPDQIVDEDMTEYEE